VLQEAAENSRIDRGDLEIAMQADLGMIQFGCLRVSSLMESVT
jgi:hypothetical protein